MGLGHLPEGRGDVGEGDVLRCIRSAGLGTDDSGCGDKSLGIPIGRLDDLQDGLLNATGSPLKCQLGYLLRRHALKGRAS